MAQREPPRKIPNASIALVGGILVVCLLSAIFLGGAISRNPFVQLLVAVLCFYTVAFLGYRILLHGYPMQEGLITPRHGEFAYCNAMLFYQFMFYPFMQSFFPLPFIFRRPFYQLLGTRFGANTHCPGVLLDPALTEFGDDVTIGGESFFTAHAAEGPRFVVARIRVGDRATIGARAMIMPGVSVGADAIVAAGSVVLKHTKIGPGELWGGVPARFLKHLALPGSTLPGSAPVEIPPGNHANMGHGSFSDSGQAVPRKA